jgi:hypothetical protein
MKRTHVFLVSCLLFCAHCDSLTSSESKAAPSAAITVLDNPERLTFKHDKVYTYTGPHTSGGTSPYYIVWPKGELINRTDYDFSRIVIRFIIYINGDFKYNTAVLVYDNLTNDTVLVKGATGHYETLHKAGRYDEIYLDTNEFKAMSVEYKIEATVR